MIKVGAITIGQSPRTDVTQDILPLLGDQVELLQAGGLDGLTREEIEAVDWGQDPTQVDFSLARTTMC